MNTNNGMAIRPRVIGLAALYLGLAAMVFLLAFCNLDGRLFWGDEAETALLAKNILKFGVPKVDDGVNHLSVHGDRYDSRDGVWTWAPWLPEYITAASFAVFGPTTWAGRAPFAFIGWLSVMLLGWVVWKIYRDHRVALSSMLLLGTSEVFLLHIRQCRYYSLTVLGEVAFIYGIYGILAKNRSGLWLVVTGLGLQLYCNFMTAAANVPVLMAMAVVLFLRDKRSAWPVAMSLGILFVIFLPWLLFAEFWRESAAEKHFTWTHLLVSYAWLFQFYFFPWCVLLLPAWGWFRLRFGQGVKPAPEPLPGIVRSFEKYLLLLPILYVPVLLAMAGAFSRYLLPLLPGMCLLVAAWVYRYVQWRALAAGLIVVQVMSNAFSIASGFPFRQGRGLRFPVIEYVSGITAPYDNRFADVLDFFKSHAHPGQRVLSFDPEFPLIFYTGLGVIDGRITAPPPGELPDWILPVSASGDMTREPVALPEFLRPHYTLVAISVRDSPIFDSMPEPDVYQFYTADGRVPFEIYELNVVTNEPAK